MRKKSVFTKAATFTATLVLAQPLSPACAKTAAAGSSLSTAETPAPLKLAAISPDLLFMLIFAVVALIMWTQVRQTLFNRRMRRLQRQDKADDSRKKSKEHAATAEDVNQKAANLLHMAEQVSSANSRHALLMQADELFSGNPELYDRLDKKTWSRVCMLLAQTAHTPLERKDFLERCYDLGAAALAGAKTLQPATIEPFVYGMLELGELAATPQERIDLYAKSAKILSITHHEDFSPLLYRQNPAGTYAESLHGDKTAVRFRLVDEEAVDPLALWQMRHYEGAALALAAREMEAGLQRESMLALAARRLTEYLKGHRYQEHFRQSPKSMLPAAIRYLTAVTGLAPRLPTPWYALALLNQSFAATQKGPRYRAIWLQALSALQEAMRLLPGVDELLFAHALFLTECPAKNLAGWWTQHSQATQAVRVSLEKNRNNPQALFTKATVLCRAGVTLGRFHETWLTQPVTMPLLERVDEAFGAALAPQTHEETQSGGENALSVLDAPEISLMYDSALPDARFGAWDKCLKSLYPAEETTANTRLEAPVTEFPEDSFEAFVLKSRQQTQQSYNPVRFESTVRKTPDAEEFQSMLLRIRADMLQEAERAADQMIMENAVCPEAYLVRSSISVERGRFATTADERDEFEINAIFSMLMSDCHAFVNPAKMTTLWANQMLALRNDGARRAFWNRALEDCSRNLKVKILEAEEHKTRQKPTAEEAALLAGYYFHCGETMRYRCFDESGNNDLYIKDLKTEAREMYIKADGLESGCSSYGQAALAASDGDTGLAWDTLAHEDGRTNTLLLLSHLDPDMNGYPW